MHKKNGTLENLAWKFAERVSVQLVSLLVSIVLARILSPEDYGVIAFVGIFIALANVLVSDGLGSALIQKKEPTAEDYFSVLYFNIAFSLLLYGIIFASAPYIAEFYGSGYEKLPTILRVLGLRIVIMTINSVQQAYISKKMIFRKFFVSTLWGTITSAIVGISMALYGCGVWALVVQNLVCDAVSTLTLAISMKKKPQFIFSARSIKALVPYGIRVLGTGLLITGYQEFRALIIGKKYSTAHLAFYDKSRHFPQLLVTNINASISAVLFPKMSNEQDNMNKIRSTMKNSMQFSSYCMCPMMLGLAAVAEPFIKVILTDKWIECVPLLQWFCIFFLFQPMHTSNTQAIKAIGRSDIVLKLELFRDVIQLAVLLCVMHISVNAIVISMSVLSILFTYVNAYPCGKFFKYGFFEQMKDILPSVIISVIMFVCVYMLNYLQINILVKLIIQCFVGICIYILLSIFSKNKQFHYIKELVKKYLADKQI